MVGSNYDLKGLVQESVYNNKETFSANIIMSDFCDFVPDDPSCAPAADPDVVTDGGDDHVEEHMDDDHEVDTTALMQANVVYLMTAMSLTINAALVQFRYRSDTTYYDAGDALTTNYWEYLNMVWNYFTIGWMGIATIT